eukprot:1671750-Prorocentrum_lima.AAC.1
MCRHRPASNFSYADASVRLDELRDKAIGKGSEDCPAKASLEGTRWRRLPGREWLVEQAHAQ